jgi:hypothetical protein
MNFLVSKAMSEHANNSKSESSVGMRAMEIVVAILFLVFGLVVMVGSIKLGSSWGDDGPQAGYFPFYISIIILISSSFTLFQSLILDRKKAYEIFVEKGPFKQVLSVLIPALVFILLLQTIGIYVAATIYISVFMIWLGKYAAWKAISVGFGVSLAMYMLFEVWFQIPLPSGTLFNPLELVGIQ